MGDESSRKTSSLPALPVLAAATIIFVAIASASASAAAAPLSPPSSGDGGGGERPDAAGEDDPDETRVRADDADCPARPAGSDGGGGGGGGGGPRLVVKPVLRVRGLSVEDFRESRRSSAPLVFEGLGDGEVDPSEWTRPKLRELCGDVPLKITAASGEYVEGCGDGVPGSGRDRACHNVRVADPELAGKAWAGLGPADLGRRRLSTVADLLDRQDAEDGAGLGLYLHDAPLLHYCPPALDLLPGVPKYFRRDYNAVNSFSALADLPEDDARFWAEHKGLRHFPSLFVGKGGGTTGSPLHSDLGLTRFWKLQLSGRKLWRVASPEDRGRLSPAVPTAPPGSGPSTLYAADLLEPDFGAHPLLDGLVVYETITEPGDVIYLPEGWPHQVRNLDDSVSVAYNFVDNGNLAAADEVHRRNLREAGREEGSDYLSCLWGSFFVPLDEPPPPPPSPSSDGAGRGGDFVPFRTFFREQSTRLLAGVPSSARRFAEGAAGDAAAGTADFAAAAAVGARRDRCGRPPPHAAAFYGLLPALEYLLDEVGVDPDLRDDRGWTALGVLELMGMRDGPAAELLRRRSSDRGRRRRRES